MVTAVLPQREPLIPALSTGRTGEGLVTPGLASQGEVLSQHAKRGVGTRPAELTRTQVPSAPTQGQKPPLFKDGIGVPAGTRYGITYPPAVVVQPPAPAPAPAAPRRSAPSRPAQGQQVNRGPKNRGPRA